MGGDGTRGLREKELRETRSYSRLFGLLKKEDEKKKKKKSRRR